MKKLGKTFTYIDKPHVGYRINFADGTYYLGVTSNLDGRIKEHKSASNTRKKLNAINDYFDKHPEIEWADIESYYTVEIMGWFKNGYDARFWEKVVHRNKSLNCISKVNAYTNGVINYQPQYSPVISCYSANL